MIVLVREELSTTFLSSILVGATTGDGMNDVGVNGDKLGFA